MFVLPSLGTSIPIYFNDVPVTATPLAYFVDKEKVPKSPFQHADEVLLRLIDLPVTQDTAVTGDFTFKVSHFKNMLRASSIPVEEGKVKHESVSESVKHLVHAMNS